MESVLYGLASLIRQMGDRGMLDYRIHYAQLVVEDRLRQHQPIQAGRPATRVHHREAPRQLAALVRR
jgi:hypothetical protein